MTPPATTTIAVATTMTRAAIRTEGGSLRKRVIRRSMCALSFIPRGSCRRGCSGRSRRRLFDMLGRGGRKPCLGARGERLAREVGDHDRDDDQRGDCEPCAVGEESRDQDRGERELQDRHARGAGEGGDRRRLRIPRQVPGEQARDHADEERGKRRAAPEVAEGDAPGETLEDEQQREGGQRDGRRGGEDGTELVLPGEEDS